ncbi:ATP-binding protein [Actinomadura sp. SCN-SB]|uniref:ATP-binding protein n=1 Tax=Actinomadura sp. SCN-SB TaxID=3373092 RepID=UPI0037534DFA
MFAGRLDQVPAARHFATFLFSDTRIVEEVAYVVTELSTNAVRHTLSGQGGSFRVQLVLNGWAYVAVTDMGGGGFPTVRPDPADGSTREYGRGLLSIAQMAVSLGVHGSPEEGHTVWADLAGAYEPPQRPHLVEAAPAG